MNMLFQIIQTIIYIEKNGVLNLVVISSETLSNGFLKISMSFAIINVFHKGISKTIHSQLSTSNLLFLLLFHTF